jgi:hypothetical protein
LEIPPIYPRRAGAIVEACKFSGQYAYAHRTVGDNYVEIDARGSGAGRAPWPALEFVVILEPQPRSTLFVPRLPDNGDAVGRKDRLNLRGER